MHRVHTELSRGAVGAVFNGEEGGRPGGCVCRTLAVDKGAECKNRAPDDFAVAIIGRGTVVPGEFPVKGLGDSAFRAGALEGLVGLYALAGLATANDVSVLSWNSLIPGLIASNYGPSSLSCFMTSIGSEQVLPSLVL
jgi:hypothetical protein